MKRRRSAAVACFISLTAVAKLRAEVATSWLGGSGNSWTNAALWSGGVVPVNNSPTGLLYDVTVGTGTANLTSGYADTIQTLNLSNGSLNGGGGYALLTINSGLNLLGMNSSSPTSAQSMVFNCSAGSNSTLQAAANASIDFNEVTINNFGTFNLISGNIGSELGTFNNKGAVVVNAGGGSVFLGFTNLAGNGSVNVQSGTLNIGSVNGTLFQNIIPTVAGGAELEFSNVGNSANMSNILGFNSPNGSLDVEQSFIAISYNQSYSASVTTLNGSELDISSPNASTGALNINSGSTLKVLNSSKIMLINNSLSTSGTVNISAGSVCFNGSSGVLNGTINLLNNSNLINNGTMTLGSGMVNNSGGTFINNGTLITNPGINGVFTLCGEYPFGGSFNNPGSTYVQSGTLVLSTAATLQGPFNVSSGATLVLPVTSQTPQMLSGTGTVIFNGGSGAIGNPLGALSLEITNISYVTYNTSTTTLAALNISGQSQFLGSGTLIITGPTIISGELAPSVVAEGGLIVGPGNFWSGTLTNAAGQLATTTPGLPGLSNYGTFVNQGTYNLSSQTLENENASAAFINTGIMNFNGSATLARGTFNNSGSYIFNAPGGTPSITPTSLLNTGLIKVQAGTLAIQPTNFGTSNTFGGSLSISTGAVVNIYLTPGTSMTSSVTGAGSLQIYGTGTVAPAGFNFTGTTKLSGTLTLAAGNTIGLNDSLIDSGKITLAANTSGELAIESISSLTVNASDSFLLQPVASATSRTLLSLGSLSLLGTLDIGNNDMLVTGGSLPTIWNAVRTGYANGAWNGSGLTSSSAKADTAHLLAVGVIQNNQGGNPLFTGSNLFDGVTPGATDILVKSTYCGDANLDGKVDGSDYTRIDNGYLTNATGWFNGDFNYDGTIDGSDYTLIDNAFNVQGAQLAGQIVQTTDEISVSPASVPEPNFGCIATVVTAALLGVRSRKRPR